jgi:AAHS family 4-hydroxybenzoate transporter-like MFS transporter
MMSGVMQDPTRPSFVLGLDDAPLRAIQIRTFLLCALVAVLDGLDTQSIGLVAPMMSKDLGLTKTAMGTIFSIAQIGATMGALAFGPLADRLGRKPATMIGVSIIVVFTYLTAIAPSFALLLGIRFIAGIGLAGVIPSILALTSEYAPSRLRGTLVAAVFAGYPAGAALGGFMAAYILAHHDWRWVFYIGSIMPLITLVLITVWMPESLRFLLARGGNRARVTKLVDELGLDSAAFAAQTDQASKERAVPLWAVFANGLALPTFLLWMIYFFVFATTKIMVVWLPTILSENSGFSVSNASLAQATFNVGCVVGMLGAGALVDRYGPARALVPALMFGAVCVASLGFVASSIALTMLVCAMIGAFVGVGGSGAHAIAARLYPIEMRSTGIGWGASASRFGQVVSPILAAMMLSGGMSAVGLYAGLAISPLIAALSVLGFAFVQRRRSRNANAEGSALPTAAAH